MITRLALLSVLALSALACGVSRKVDVRLYPRNFPELPPGQDVEMWVGETTRSKIPIAIISSQRTAERSRGAREAQFEELKERARRIGADGIENLRVETATVRGFVADPRVPFTAFKQGDFELYFVRGTAVRYTDAAPVALSARATPAEEELAGDVEELTEPLTEDVPADDAELNSGTEADPEL